MPYITDVYAREVLDSRGNPTIEVEVITESGAFGSTLVPSEASEGEHADVGLGDGDEARSAGNGAIVAVANVNHIIVPEVIGIDVTRQNVIDRFMIELDGTKNNAHLGAYVIL